jgi:N-hydroxyarylamine O-acetyltransferase
VLDLDAYLARLGLSGRPGLAEIHSAHVTSIPFENLDPHTGSAVSLDIGDLQRKLVIERRGGYCFEHNLLLREVLLALGAEVDMFLARVRLGAPPGVTRPRSHLVLRVRSNEGDWHADVGFGNGTLLEPIPFGPGTEHEQAGWRYRVVEEDGELVLQGLRSGEWEDEYAFLPHPVAPIDVETINWYVSTHPSSPFVSGLIVARQFDDGTRLAMSDWSELSLTESTPAASTTTALDPSEIPDLLTERFGLAGWTRDTDGRLVHSEP